MEDGLQFLNDFLDVSHTSCLLLNRCLWLFGRCLTDYHLQTVPQTVFHWETEEVHIRRLSRWQFAIDYQQTPDPGRSASSCVCLHQRAVKQPRFCPCHCSIWAPQLTCNREDSVFFSWCPRAWLTTCQSSGFDIRNRWFSSRLNRVDFTMT